MAWTIECVREAPVAPAADVARTGEIAREADAQEAEAGDAFREAQREVFARVRGE